MSAETEIQKAVYTSLSGNATFAAKVAGIYDAAPQFADGGNAANFPFVTIGSIAPAEYDTQSKTGFDAVIRMHSFSRSSAMRQVKEIQGAAYDVLHLGSLTMTGYRLVIMRRETSDVQRDSDGSFHGVCDYRALIEKI